MFHPLPVSPSPAGRFLIDTLLVNSIPSPGFRREPHRRSCLNPWHGFRRAITLHRAPLSNGRVVGVVDVNRSTRDAGGRGGDSLNKGRIHGDVQRPAVFSRKTIFSLSEPVSPPLKTPFAPTS